MLPTHPATSPAAPVVVKLGPHMYVPTTLALTQNPNRNPNPSAPPQGGGQAGAAHGHGQAGAQREGVEDCDLGQGLCGVGAQQELSGGQAEGLQGGARLREVREAVCRMFTGGQASGGGV